jgi:hypothetical protein
MMQLSIASAAIRPWNSIPAFVAAPLIEWTLNGVERYLDIGALGTKQIATRAVGAPRRKGFTARTARTTKR